ncbi:terminase large subunit [Halorubrum tailed virus 28]|uniref:Terminase large subunit n=1 Tax=Halorubrum tailed virus 28 TaxID=2878009 RepID=A0AAE9BYC1_9CAUD|nr:terminase large subunit [Halorubrum tailed virus 28]UBF23440.1 terminase large subunit [Halorubrum tailed virus 28]
MSGKTTSNWDFELWDAQSRTWEYLDGDGADLVVFRGGYGSGKTILGVRWIITTALRVPKSDNLILAPDSQKGGPTTYKAFFEELPGEETVPDEGGDPENSPLIAEYNRVERRATFQNGAIVRLGSADVWNRYAGGEFNAIYCDEVAHYENTDLYDLHEMLITRQRTDAGPNVTLWTSTGNGYNQFYDITERRVQPDGEGGEEPLPWAESMRVVVANSLHNPFLNEKEKYRRQFEGTEREAQALKGGFSAAKGLVYGQFTRKSHERDGDTMPELRDTYFYGYDHGWDDPRVMLQIGKTVHDQYAILDEFYESQAKVSRAVEWLEERPKGRVYAEHEPEHIEMFRQAGYPTEKAVKDLDEGIPLVREFLETDDEGRPGLLVHEDCVNTIQEFQSYKEDHVGKSKAADHAMDSLRYVLATRELDLTPDPSDVFGAV